ncbi:LysR family transcriptional regulator [Paenibacillus wulumuqiensis]|uniref:LysR family transcriptional regulator n=1 Tax=Paenibacillus wulumuqiensis TaxID=1567107 RepID=UPI0006193182|nr:LysR family transcriptional regulator [Paenibacillus wulumuqiensis]
MESRHLFTFLTVVETGSFTRAAHKLDYAQSSITAQIQALEQELNTPLFDRINKKILLTDAGRRLLPYAQEIARMHDMARDVVRSSDEPGGTLNIGAPESLAASRLPDIIREFRNRYPNVRMILRPGNCTELKEQVRRGELDIVFTLLPEEDDRDLHMETLVEERMTLIAPMDHPLVLQPQVLPEHLRLETILHTETGCLYRNLFEQHLNRHGIFTDPSLEFWSIEAIKQCVMAGLGLSFLPTMTVRRELEEGKLAALAWNDDNQRVCTQMVYHLKKWQSPSFTAFVELARTHAVRWRDEIGVGI